MCSRVYITITTTRRLRSGDYRMRRKTKKATSKMTKGASIRLSSKLYAKMVAMSILLAM